MKNILITGVCGGMGYAAARQFAQSGFRVFGIDRRTSCDLPIDYFCADITDSTSIDEVRAKISAETEKLNAILHFAGIYNLDSLIEISEEEFVRIFNINLFGIYRVNKAFVPMLDNGGRIVITSSELAPLDPLPFTGLYAITKSAVEKYAYSLRMELNLHGISVSVIRPGAVKTDMLGVSTVA
ncbi:MAG: SDR family oxidoreductase, partial [Eubacteriales bacterium]